MAKRRAAEPLTFHVPWKRLLLCDVPEEPPPPPPLWIPPPGQPRGAPEPPPPRKRKIDAGPMAEPAASPSKRREGGRPGGPGGAGEPERRGLDLGGPTPPPPPPSLLPERPRRGPGEEPRGARPPRGGGGRGDDDGAGRGEPPRGDVWGASPRQLNEDFWQYNTFQYWRNPLPPIDLADIEAITEDNLAKAKLQDKNEEVEVDMES
ncbi:uncharacterized protein C9orf40 homolog [Sorex fumeus]|uniref:uncharacterized protein C9orf40 homolog n=1 Tax=Sorex fumeus TaxID=62283 RepID=UPI0024ADCF48|nr:uncharacterized protein C9orf40 homolog [Sorex fumeus]